MKTAIFGGTFNPVHIGHLIIAEEVLARTGFDEILFIPAFIPPHKPVDDPGADIRYTMLERSLAWNRAFRCSDCEIRRKGTSYTIDTVRWLVAEGLIEPVPGLIIGDDLLEGFNTWKEPESLVRETRIIVARRLAHAIPHVFPSFEYLENPVFPVSSSEIRERAASGRAWKSLVPAEARKIIEEQHLYGFGR